MQPKSLISVVVPHLNQVDELEAALRSLAVQSLDRACFEVIVVDNGSTVPLEPAIVRHPGTRLLCEPGPGPGLARNRGAQAANGDILCFMDADCCAHPDWLQSAIRALNSSPPGTILGGDVRISRDEELKLTALEAYESIFAYRFKLYIERHGYSGTGNLAVRRSDFEKVGPFGGVNIAEDFDWGQRARAAGMIFRYVPDMIVFHPARRSLKALFVKWDRHIHHALNMMRGQPLWQVHWFGRAFVVLLSPTVDAFKVLTSNRIEGASARAKALGVLIVVRAYRAWRMAVLPLLEREVVWNRETEIDQTKASLEQVQKR